MCWLLMALCGNVQSCSTRRNLQSVTGSMLRWFVSIPLRNPPVEIKILLLISWWYSLSTNMSTWHPFHLAHWRTGNMPPVRWQLLRINWVGEWVGTGCAHACHASVAPWWCWNCLSILSGEGIQSTSPTDDCSQIGTPARDERWGNFAVMF